MKIVQNDYSCPDFNPISPSDPCYVCPDFAECDGCTCRFDCIPISPNMDAMVLGSRPETFPAHGAPDSSPPAFIF